MEYTRLYNSVSNFFLNECFNVEFVYKNGVVMYQQYLWNIFLISYLSKPLSFL